MSRVPVVLGEWSTEQPNRSGWYHVWLPRAWKDKQTWTAYWCLERLCWTSAYYQSRVEDIPRVAMSLDRVQWKAPDHRFKWRSVGDTFSTENKS